jgi:L-2-hydroxyglutarate oxidase LhgO
MNRFYWNKSRIIVIGGGIVGLTLANKLIEENRNLNVILFEKENDLGKHASGLNSGVIHSGIYNKPASMKSTFAISGNEKMKTYIRKKNLSMLETGKLIIAQDNRDSDYLRKMHESGKSVGIISELLSSPEILEKEPLAKAEFESLWVPSTAIGNPRELIHSLRDDFLALGGRIELNSKIKVVDSTLYVDNEAIGADHVINCAGMFSQELAEKFGFGIQYKVMPFLGTYRQTKIENIPLRTLIYPVPHPVNPFLGTHWTITLDGKIKIGPSAIPVIGLEHYSLAGKFRVSDFLNYFENSKMLIKDNKGHIRNLFMGESLKVFEKYLARGAFALLNYEPSKIHWEKREPGIRSQLINRSSGEFIQDYVIEGDKYSTHILNAVSPGWTSSFAFAEYVSKLVFDKIN